MQKRQVLYSRKVMMIMKVNKLERLLLKADERLMLSCFGVDDDMSDVRGAVYRKLKEKAIDNGLKVLGIDRYRVAYNIRVISDKSGVRCDKRTLPKDLRMWIDCPYEFDVCCDANKIEHGEYRAVVSYKSVDGTHEYPYDCDLYMHLERLEKTTH